MPKRKPKRKRPRKGIRSRFKTAADAGDQLNQISNAQSAVRKRKMAAVIDSVEKSKQRLMNRIRSIRDIDDANREFQ